MELFGSNIFSFRKREVTPPAPAVPSSTNEQEPKVQGGDYQERIAYVRGPEQALVVGAVYRAVNLRADTMSVMPVQYQKRDFEAATLCKTCAAWASASTTCYRRSRTR